MLILLFESHLIIYCVLQGQRKDCLISACTKILLDHIRGIQIRVSKVRQMDLDWLVQSRFPNLQAQMWASRFFQCLGLRITHCILLDRLHWQMHKVQPKNLLKILLPHSRGSSCLHQSHFRRCHVQHQGKLLLCFKKTYFFD